MANRWANNGNVEWNFDENVSCTNLCCRMGKLRGNGEMDTFSIGFPYFSTFASFCPPFSTRMVFKKINALLGSKITVDGDCSHEIKRCLLLQEKL